MRYVRGLAYGADHVCCAIPLLLDEVYIHIYLHQHYVRGSWLCLLCNPTVVESCYGVRVSPFSHIHIHRLIYALCTWSCQGSWLYLLCVNCSWMKYTSTYTYISIMYEGADYVCCVWTVAGWRNEVQVSPSSHIHIHRLIHASLCTWSCPGFLFWLYLLCVNCSWMT